MYLGARGWTAWKGGSTAARNAKGGFYTTGERGGADDYFRKRVCPNESKPAQLNHWYLLAAEYKAGKDKQRDSQIKFQQRWEADGGCYLIVRDVNDLVELGL